jgi:hypothetical protein
MTETNLWPPRPEMWECSTNKGRQLHPRCISAGCPTVVRCTSAVGHKVLAFMTPGAQEGSFPWQQASGRVDQGVVMGEVAIVSTNRIAELPTWSTVQSHTSAGRFFGNERQFLVRTYFCPTFPRKFAQLDFHANGAKVASQRFDCLACFLVSPV